MFYICQNLKCTATGAYLIFVLRKMKIFRQKIAFTHFTNHAVYKHALILQFAQCIPYTFHIKSVSSIHTVKKNQSG